MSKHTQGPCRVGEGRLRITADSGVVICDVAGGVGSESAVADAELIAEAFNVATETGLTPRQLAEQRADLFDALKYARRFLRAAEHDVAYIDGLIAKSTAK